jgi:hypothetical protein
MQDGLDQGFRIERAYAPATATGEGRGSRPSRRSRPAILVRVTLTPCERLTKETRATVAVTRSACPPGFEPVGGLVREPPPPTSARAQDEQSPTSGDDWAFWRPRGFRPRRSLHAEPRAALRYTPLSPRASSVFTYVARATVPHGTFRYRAHPYVAIPGDVRAAKSLRPHLVPAVVTVPP